jgi:serine/threonine-protein kinase
VRHPNIVEVSDLVQETPAEGGRVYFVMELLEGQSVRDAARTSPFTLKRAIEVVRQAAEALQAAHAVGVVHRDIKPDNLFLTRGPDGREILKVLDFGVARMGLGLPGFSRATMVGQVVGTPLWMAPEQLLGRDVDARADVYALGTVLYVLLVRKFPFEGATMDDVVLERLVKEAALLGVTTAQGETVPQALRDVVAQCLARESKKRPASMSEVVEKLKAIEQAMAQPQPPSVDALLDDADPDALTVVVQAPLPEQRRRSYLPWVFAAATTGAAIALAIWFFAFRH